MACSSSANRTVCYCVARYENFAVNQKASIFVSYVIKEFAHAFSCAYIEDITRWREDMNFMFEWQEHFIS